MGRGRIGWVVGLGSATAPVRPSVLVVVTARPCTFVCVRGQLLVKERRLGSPAERAWAL